MLFTGTQDCVAAGGAQAKLLIAPRTREDLQGFQPLEAYRKKEPHKLHTWELGEVELLFGTMS